MDGNNSLKRLATRKAHQVGDTRIFSSDYILPREFVDRFANEVKSRQKQSKPTLQDSHPDGGSAEPPRPVDGTAGCGGGSAAAGADPITPATGEGVSPDGSGAGGPGPAGGSVGSAPAPSAPRPLHDPTDGKEDQPDGGCAANWKAAASDEEKRMWGIFEETGIFACACRHSIILWICDMYRSGEL